MADDGESTPIRSASASTSEDPRFTKALGLVRAMSNPHLKEQCIRTEWAATETDLERDLLLETASDPAFWSEVKQMTAADVEVLPNEESTVDTDERLKQMFKTFDKDNSGTIDANELHQMLLYMGISTTEQEIKDMIAQVDKNGDGDIDLPEFLQVMKGAQAGQLGSPHSKNQAVRTASFRAQKNADDHERARADQQRAADADEESQADSS